MKYGLFGCTLFAAISFQMLWCLADDDVNQPAFDDLSQAQREAVPHLLEKLSASTLTERQQAEEELLKLGPGVLLILPPPELMSSPAAKQAVRRIRIRLEYAAARRSIGPAQISLAGSFSTTELAHKIREQTGNHVQVSESLDASNRRLAVDWKGLTFWEAIHDLEKADLHLEFSTEVGEFVLVGRSQPAATEQTVIQGPFRFRIAPIVATRQTGSDAKQPPFEKSILHTSVAIATEPRMRPLILWYSGRDFTLAASEADSFPSFDPDAKLEIPLGHGGRETRIELRFLAHGTMPVKLQLRGQTRMLIAAAEQPIEFLDVGSAAGVARRRAGVTVLVQKVDVVRHANGRFAISLRVHVNYDVNARAFESHQTWVFHNKVYLENAAGQRSNPAEGAQTLFQRAGSVGIEYRFIDLPSNPNDWRFVYLAPTLLIEAPIAINAPAVPVLSGTPPQNSGTAN